MYLLNTKQTIHVLNSKRWFILTLLTLVPLFIASCSQSVRFAVSSVVPSAEGSVKLTKDENQNKMIVLKVRNLVDPSRLTPAKKLYLVWMQTKNDGNKNLGRLVSSEAYFSTERNAKFTSVTTFDPVKIFITAEDKADATNPSGVTILETSEF
jgi:hypothetical protein